MQLRVGDMRDGKVRRLPVSSEAVMYLHLYVNLFLCLYFLLLVS